MQIEARRRQRRPLERRRTENALVDRPLAVKEVDTGVAPLLRDLLGDRQGRIDMPTRAPAGEEK